MAHLLGAENIALEYPTKIVFGDGRGAGITLGLEEGDRIGVDLRNPKAFLAPEHVAEEDEIPPGEAPVLREATGPVD